MREQLAQQIKEVETRHGQALYMVRQAELELAFLRGKLAMLEELQPSQRSSTDATEHNEIRDTVPSNLGMT